MDLDTRLSVNGRDDASDVVACLFMFKIDYSKEKKKRRQTTHSIIMVDSYRLQSLYVGRIGIKLEICQTSKKQASNTFRYVKAWNQDELLRKN